MKSIVKLIAVVLATIIILGIGAIQNSTALKVISLIMACAIAIYLCVSIVKYTLKFLSKYWTSVLYVTILIAIMGLLSWHKVINEFVGYSMGVVLGGLLIILLYRRLAKWAQKSLIGGELFATLSNYKIRAYIEDKKIVSHEVKVQGSLELKNVILVLRELEYSSSEAKEAAQYAIENTGSNSSIEEKVKMALVYLNDNKKEVNNN